MPNTAEKARPGLGSRFIALGLNLLAIGAGQVFLGHWRRGLAWLAGQLLLYLVFGFALVPLGTTSFVAAAVMTVLVVGFPYLGPTIDVFLIPKERLARARIHWVIVAVLGSGVLTSLAAWTVRTQFAEAFKIPSGAMTPTLAISDHIFVDKTIEWTGEGGTVRRGDVIVFEYPNPDPSAPKQNYVKRVIGFPGDTIEERDGLIFINDKPLKRCPVGSHTLNPDDPPSELFVEFAGKRSYLIAQSDLPPETWGPYRVPQGELFVLGDNRDASSDSRRWNQGRGGGVPVGKVHGRAAFVWLSFDGEALARGRIGLNIHGKPSLPGGAPEVQPAIERCLGSR